MPYFPDQDLFNEMTSLFHATTVFNPTLKTVGNEMIQRFKDRTGGTFTNSELNNEVFKSTEFKKFIGNSFGQLLRNSLASHNWNINLVPLIPIPLNKRPIFDGAYNKFHGLTILINDTEYTEVTITGFSIDPVTHKWTAKLHIEIFDHFGLDKRDAITYQNVPFGTGFAAWWILQHKRNYYPFITKVVNDVYVTYNPDDDPL